MYAFHVAYLFNYKTHPICVFISLRKEQVQIRLPISLKQNLQIRVELVNGTLNRFKNFLDFCIYFSLKAVHI